MVDKHRYEVTEEDKREGPPQADGGYNYNVLVNSTLLAIIALALAGAAFMIAY